MLQLPLSALFAWLAMMSFSLVPKRLSTLDFLFLYCVSLILTTATFTTWDIDLGLATVVKTPRTSFAVIISRVITTPVLYALVINALYGKPSKWGEVVGWWLVLVGYTVFWHSFGFVSFNASVFARVSILALTTLLSVAVLWVLCAWFKKKDQEEGTTR